MEFGSVRFEYRRQRPDGSLGTPVTFDWDIRQGTVGTGP
jgi:type VI secretion system secreted protein Hcp